MIDTVAPIPAYLEPEASVRMSQQEPSALVPRFGYDHHTVTVHDVLADAGIAAGGSFSGSPRFSL